MYWLKPTEAERCLCSNDGGITCTNLSSMIRLQFILDQSTAAIFSTSINLTVTSYTHNSLSVQVHIKLGVQIINFKYSSQCGQIVILKNKIFIVFPNTLNISRHAVHKFTHLFTIVRSYWTYVQNSFALSKCLFDGCSHTIHGLFTLHGSGTGTGYWTSTTEDNGSGFCPCLSAVWTVQHNIQKPIVPFDGPGSVQCERATMTILTTEA